MAFGNKIEKQQVKERLLQQFLGFLNTPSLWLKNASFTRIFHTTNDVVVNSLEEIPEPRNLVLGKRMEEFFRFYVERFSEEEVLAFNEQIIREKTTLGELDFLLKNSRTSEIFHVELVYKFYLYDPVFSEDEIQRWVGPNKRDFLVRKLERLREHQFPLLHHPATATLLGRLQIPPEEVVQKLCFKANLFVPRSLRRAPEEVNPKAIQGFWIRQDEFTADEFGNSQFFSPRIQDWPILPRHNNTWFSFTDFSTQVQQFLKQKQSPLVWMKSGDNKFARFFIVWW